MVLASVNHLLTIIIHGGRASDVLASLNYAPVHTQYGGFICNFIERLDSGIAVALSGYAHQSFALEYNLIQ